MSAIEKVIHELSPQMGDRVSLSPGLRKQHSEDLSHFPDVLPDAVALPHSTKEVQQIMLACSRHKVPVVAFGVGTSLEGHILAVNGGLCVDLGQMNKVLKVNETDLDVTVQAGCTRMQLNSYLRDTGLFFPVDPGADATLGGMAATRASGTNAVRYGTMKENVLSLKVVLPDGRVITTAGRARKSSAGYDLTRLFVGSEGTLGIITEVTVRLFGRPEMMSSAFCTFADIQSAVNAVIETIQLGIPVASIELMDEASIRAINAFSKTGFQERPTLLLEFHGSEVSTRDQVTQFTEIANSYGAADMQWAESEEESNHLWQARHDAAHAVSAYVPDSSKIYTDVCVPISALAECITATQADIAETGLFAPIIGHVGDGNFHLLICVDKQKPAEMLAATGLNQRLVERALALGGTCTGEHGIGLGKKDFLVQELGEAVDIMRTIKAAIDPQNLMNPGKIFDLQP